MAYKFQFKTDVVQRYLNGESSFKIAKSERCHYKTLLKKLKNEGIKRRPAGNKFQFKTDIAERYLVGESTYQIAQSEGCNQVTVLTRLKEIGIKIRPVGGGGAKHWTKQEDKLLERLYLNPENFIEEIAKILNRTNASIFDRIKRLGLREKHKGLQRHKYREKICERCGVKYFPTSGGPQKYCLSCGKKRIKEIDKKHWKKYYDKFKEREKNRKAVWYQKNKERIKERQKKYRENQKQGAEIKKDKIEQKIVTKINKLIVIISAVYGIPQEMILGRERTAIVVKARHICMYLMKEALRLSFPKIGEIFRGRDHSTVFHAYSKISREYQQNKKTKADIDSIRTLLG